MGDNTEVSFAKEFVTQISARRKKFSSDHSVPLSSLEPRLAVLTDLGPAPPVKRRRTEALNDKPSNVYYYIIIILLLLLYF